MGTMTGVEFYTELKAALGQQTTTSFPAANAVWCLNFTLDHLASPKVYRHPELQETTTGTLGTGTRLYNIVGGSSGETIALDSVVIAHPTDTYRRRRLQRLRARDAFEESGRRPNQEPLWYSQWGASQIEVHPAPSATENGWSLLIRRIKAPAKWTSGNLTSGSVVSPYATVWDEAILQGAIWRGWRWLTNWERAEQAKGEFGQLVNEIADRLRVEAEDDDFGPDMVIDEVMP